MLWTRNDSIELGKLALQAGFADVKDAADALEIGARLQAYNFTAAEFEQAISYLWGAGRA